MNDKEKRLADGVAVALMIYELGRWARASFQWLPMYRSGELEPFDWTPVPTHDAACRYHEAVNCPVCWVTAGNTWY